MPCILNNREFQVLQLILSFAQQYNECYLSQNLIADKIKISVRQVQRIIQSLKRKNFLLVERDNIQKAKHLNNNYKVVGNPPCRLECRLECRLLIINNNKYYYLYSTNINNNIYNNIPASFFKDAGQFSQNKNKEDKDMDIKKQHLQLLMEKDMLSIKSEYVFKLFYLLCDEYGFKIPHVFYKKDIGIIKKFQKAFQSDKELKDFFKFVIKNWISLIYKFKIASTVPDIRIINLKFNDFYNAFKQSYQDEEQEHKGVSKYIKKED